MVFSLFIILQEGKLQTNVCVCVCTADLSVVQKKAVIFDRHEHFSVHILTSNASSKSQNLEK